MATLLSREAILSAPIVTRDVEAFGAMVRVRALSLKSRLALGDAIAVNHAAHTAWLDDQALPEDQRTGVERVDLLDSTIVCILFAICDEEGEALFTIEDYDRFTEMDYPDLAKLWANFQELNTRPDGNTLKKTSVTTRNGASRSGSRSRSAKRSSN